MEMSAVLVREIGSFELARVPLRDPEDDEVLIQVEVTGLCRTDLKLIRVGHRDLTLPRIPGEEVVGVVRKTGRNVTSVREGARVYVYPGVWCGRCPACRSKAENLCRDMRIMGFHRDGGFAEFVIAPEQSIIPVPRDLSAEHAVFAEPLSCCLNALELSRLQQGETIGIWGAGPAGTLLARAARAMGAEAFPIDPDQRRREIAGGSVCRGGEKFDVCIVAVGSKQAYQEALGSLNPRGRLVVFSGLQPSEDELPVSFNQLHYYEQTLVGAYGCSFRHGIQALDWIASGAVPVDDMISHRMPLSELDAALDIVEKRQGMKIHLYP
ncbi:MAG: alcohol dehydrogenase catalytic domain-containing protein [Syntrophobacter sp.]